MKMIDLNLMSALDIAIRHQRDLERNVLRYENDSALLAGWKQVQEALDKGEHVEIVSFR